MTQGLTATLIPRSNPTSICGRQYYVPWTRRFAHVSSKNESRATCLARLPHGGKFRAGVPNSVLGGVSRAFQSGAQARGCALAYAGIGLALRPPAVQKSVMRRLARGATRRRRSLCLGLRGKSSDCSRVCAVETRVESTGSTCGLNN